MPFRTDVYKLLFGGKWENPPRGRGRLYSEADFSSQYFKSNWFVCYDKFGSGFRIRSPVRLDSVVRFSPLCFDKDTDGTLVPKT